jgi:hypothetical protein
MYGLRPTFIFSGDRDWTDRKLPGTVLRGLRNQFGTGRHPTRELLIVHGHNPNGLDAIVESLCGELMIDTDPMPADWDLYGPSAGPRRNREMLHKYVLSKEHKLHAVFGFHNEIFSQTPRGNKRGTRDMLDIAANEPILTFLLSEWPVSQAVGR